MSTFKGLFDKARKVAADRLPAEVVDAGRKLRDRVVERAPAPIADALTRVLSAEEAASDAGASPGADPPSAATTLPNPPSAEPGAPKKPSSPVQETPRENPQDVLERVRARADKGLKPEDRLVVIYATAEEAEAAAEIRKQFDAIETSIREFDLEKEPQTKKQIERLSGVMVPPYVFINGRYWGTQFEIETMAQTGDLEKVVANRLDEIGEEARRIGKVHETYSDEISVDNILSRWRMGHILCVDDLDAWYEVDRDGSERFFYQGGPRPVEDMSTVAQEIVDGVEREEMDVAWLLDPAVQLH